MNKTITTKTKNMDIKKQTDKIKVFTSGAIHHKAETMLQAVVRGKKHPFMR